MFLTKKEEEEVVEAIKKAESNTSGEIRVHIEKKKSKDKSCYHRAVTVFEKLGMHNTKLRNGVLFFINLKAKEFAIIGDKGINDLVSEDFWEGVKSILKINFSKSQFKQGLVEGILKAGDQLKHHFPSQGENDVNEIPDQISTF